MTKKSTDPTAQSGFANLPSVDSLLRGEHIDQLLETYGRDSVKQAFVSELTAVRRALATELASAEPTSSTSTPSREELSTQITHQAEAALIEKFAPSIRPVINLTGIVLHTNLGRAPYPQAAIDAMVSVSTGAANVEYNLGSGKRGKRDDHVAHWLCELTGAEAATTVNNNAAAVLLVLNTLAEKRQVIVSRGELIEIGGSFRMPDIMQKARCKLVEVGTTNRTHAHDYRRALTKKTAALMKVHTSNFEIAGFGHSVSVAELASIAKAHAAETGQTTLPVIDDMGSGNLIDLTKLGLPPERTARQAIEEGADIITFSGDKLLGGPQCGLIAGKKHWIDQINRNPLKRAMRLDKLTLAALEAVLKLYSKPDAIAENIPALAILTRTPDDIGKTAQRLSDLLSQKMPKAIEVSIRPCESQIGSGALPTRTIPSVAVVLESTDAKYTAESIAGVARSLPMPVIGRVHKGALWFDCRALTDETTAMESVSQWPAH